MDIGCYLPRVARDLSTLPPPHWPFQIWLPLSASFDCFITRHAGSHSFMSALLYHPSLSSPQICSVLLHRSVTGRHLCIDRRISRQFIKPVLGRNTALNTSLSVAPGPPGTSRSHATATCLCAPAATAVQSLAEAKYLQTASQSTETTSSHNAYLWHHNFSNHFRFGIQHSDRHNCDFYGTHKDYHNGQLRLSHTAFQAPHNRFKSRASCAYRMWLVLPHHIPSPTNV